MTIKDRSNRRSVGYFTATLKSRAGLIAASVIVWGVLLLSACNGSSPTSTSGPQPTSSNTPAAIEPTDTPSGNDKPTTQPPSATVTAGPTSTGTAVIEYALPSDSIDPVLSASLGRDVYVPNTSTVHDGEANLHVTPLKVTPLNQARSVTGHSIIGTRDPLQDLELALARLLSVSESSGTRPLSDLSPAEEVMEILLGDTQGRVYDGFALLNYNRGAFAPGHVPGEYKMKRLTYTGETVISQIDGEQHKVWEVTVNLLWYRQNFDSDTFLLQVPFDAHPFDEFRVNWRIYSLIQEDLAPSTIMNDGFGRIFHGFDSTFTSIPAGTLSEITIKYPSILHFKGIYNWGWGSHPPRVHFLQPVLETNEDGDLNPVGQSFATRNREDLVIENISEAAPEKKAYKVAAAALDGANGAEIAAMLSDGSVRPFDTFRGWLRLADDQRQLPSEAWEILKQEDGLERGEFGPYDIVIAFMNNETYGESPYSSFGAEGKGGVIRDWDQGEVVQVKILNLDNHVHYYRNVDFGSRFSEDVKLAFGNGEFSFGKFNAKPTYGVPKIAEMQWRTGWGFVPHLGIAGQSGVFLRDSDNAKVTPFTDQLGESHIGYLFEGVSGYWRFDPPEVIREGERVAAGDALRDADGEDGVKIGLDTEAFGVAKMPATEISTHPNQEQFPLLNFPGFLRNPLEEGGDIIPPTPAWSPFLVFNPETGTLRAPDGSWWVDQTYYHGRPVQAGGSIVANVEAPRASGQLFYQFDPLFHDNTVFSVHPSSDALR